MKKICLGDCLIALFLLFIFGVFFYGAHVNYKKGEEIVGSGKVVEVFHATTKMGKVIPYAKVEIEGITYNVRGNFRIGETLNLKKKHIIK